MKHYQLENHILYIRRWLRFRKNLLLFKKQKRSALFLDIDGTIWPDSGPGSLVNGKVVRPEIHSYILKLKREFDFFVLVTNQTYFSRKVQHDRNEIETYFHNACELAKNLGVDLVLSCPHHPEAQNNALRKNCDFRKPNPGMFRFAIKLLDLDQKKCVVVGDRITDIIASAEAKINNNFLLVNPDAFQLNISKPTNIEVGVFFRIVNSLEDVIYMLGRQ